jgi:polyisoprenoid-binding protein YceI
MHSANDLYQFLAEIIIRNWRAVQYSFVKEIKLHSMRNSTCLLLLLLSMLTATAQQQYVLSAKESKMTFSGTSSLHAWQCRVEQPSGKLSATVDNQLVTTISSLTLSIPVTSIKSIGEKGEYYDKNMDKNVYRALHAEKYPTITFSLSQFVKKGTISKGLAVEGLGVLRINGVSREILLSGICTVTSNSIIIEGKIPLKMRDYNVEPPTAIFGTIKTGNEITIDYKMVYRLLP